MTYLAQRELLGVLCEEITEAYHAIIHNLEVALPAPPPE